MHAVFIGCAAASILSVILLCAFLFIQGGAAISKIGLFDFVFGSIWKPRNTPPSFGILPMIASSVLVTVGAVLIGVPIGLFTSIFLAKFCPKPLHRLIKPAVELMAGIPSVVYGYFGMMVIVPGLRTVFVDTFGMHTNGFSMLAAMILLGIMILPTTIGLSEAAISVVPRSYYEGAVALGASHEKAVLSIVVPAAKSGIVAAVVLAIGRAIGETMAVIMVAGGQPVMPTGLLDGTRTMTMNIVMEMSYAEGLHREALIATGTVLFTFILGINLLFTRMKRKGAAQ